MLCLFDFGMEDDMPFFVLPIASGSYPHVLKSGWQNLFWQKPEISLHFIGFLWTIFSLTKCTECESAIALF